MPDEDYLRKLNRHSTVTVDGTDEATSDQIDTGTLSDDYTRHVWNVELSNPNAAPVVISIYQGDATTHLRTLIDKKTIPAYGNAGLVIDMKAPRYSVRPDTSAATTTGNRIYGIVNANSLDVVINWYDLHA